MDSRELQPNERSKLKSMLSTLFPEYPSIAVGTEYVSFSTVRQPTTMTEWTRIHWVPLLMGEGIRRISLLGRKDKSWIQHIVSSIVYSFIYPSSLHPVDVVYDQYLSVVMEFKLKIKRDDNDTQEESEPKELLQKV
jgi:hypothetical protein